MRIINPSNLHSTTKLTLGSPSKRPNRSGRISYGWLCAWILLSGFCLFKAIEPEGSSELSAANAALQHGSHLTNPSSDRPLTTKKIQDIRVGDRLPARNPVEAFDDSLGAEVDPLTWRKIELRAKMSDGDDEAQVTLLRPLWWLEEHSVKLGNNINISSPELGIDGYARVVDIADCPSIQSGNGQVVTGTFIRPSRKVVDMYVEGLDEPIGVTAQHPFWSAARNAFVPAGELLPGERLESLRGSPILSSIIPRGTPESVYNLEVHGEHVYYISSSGLLVHNTSNPICNPSTRVDSDSRLFSDRDIDDALRRFPDIEQDSAMLGDLMFHQDRTAALQELRNQLQIPLSGKAGKTPKGMNVNPKPGLQSAHTTPQATFRGLPSYNPDEMITRFLWTGKGQPHTLFDQFWQKEFRAIRARTGRNTTTARELERVVTDAAKRSGAFTAAEAQSVTGLVYDDLYRTLGLSPDSILRIPGAPR